mmetsp:Transcript_25289/g.50622  ORF Transcript_25289/g.50622 Transcript_25289/m.50622 type:complete len:217 (-) Transcript_25289:1286-1936(-)
MFCSAFLSSDFSIRNQLLFFIFSYASSASALVGTNALNFHAATSHTLAAPVVKYDSSRNPIVPNDDVNADSTREAADLPNRYPSTPITSLPKNRLSKSRGTYTISSNILRTENSNVFITKKADAIKFNEGSPFVPPLNFGTDTKQVITNISIGIPFHSMLGSVYLEVAGRMPNWNTQLSTLIVAKKLPIQPALSVSSEITSETFVTVNTFNTVDNP